MNEWINEWVGDGKMVAEWVSRRKDGQMGGPSANKMGEWITGGLMNWRQGR